MGQFYINQVQVDEHSLNGHVTTKENKQRDGLI
jgi:hypothetical protein